MEPACFVCTVIKDANEGIIPFRVFLEMHTTGRETIVTLCLVSCFGVRLAEH